MGRRLRGPAVAASLKAAAECSGNQSNEVELAADAGLAKDLLQILPRAALSEAKLGRRIQRACPTGKSVYVNRKTIAFVKPSREKYSSSDIRKIMVLLPSSRLDRRGAFGQSSPDVERGMRWTWCLARRASHRGRQNRAGLLPQWQVASRQNDDLSATETTKPGLSGVSTR
jgi:hypothetical protein